MWFLKCPFKSEIRDPKGQIRYNGKVYYSDHLFGAYPVPITSTFYISSNLYIILVLTVIF